MVVSGGVLGVAFDAYRVVAREARLRRVLRSFLDVVYWLAATVLVFRVLYETNLGEVRLFVFLGLLLGLSLYFALISRWAVLAFRWAVAFVRRLARFAVRLFDMLIVRPIRFFVRCLEIVWGFIGVLTIFLYKFVLQLLYPLRMFLRWVARPLRRRLGLFLKERPKLARWLQRAARAARFWRR
jgi:spore cortex biosynthesis protein YabQ